MHGFLCDATEPAAVDEKIAAESVSIGITNLIFTFVGLWLIDRLGRRTLLYIGSYGYIIWNSCSGGSPWRSELRSPCIEMAHRE